MPKPDKKTTYGEQKRLTEKEKYRVLAETQPFVEHAKKLRAIPNQLDEETQISPDTRAMLNSIAKDLEELNAVWREYSTAYLNVNRTQKDEMVKEVNNMKRLLSGLNRIKERMDAFQNSKNPVDERKVAEREEFAKCYASVANIAGHYHEMVSGTLVVPKMIDEQKSKMIMAKKDINIVSEKSIKYMIELTASDEVVGAEMGYEDQFDTPLFSHEPTQDDIMQGKLGDCYFVASLSSVAANNPQIIRDMMKDNGDGTVTVRLYDEKENGKLEPIYINVEKSVPVIKLRKADGSQSVEDINAKGTLWVQMLEKAFAASNIHDNGMKKFSETERSYSDIIAGTASNAYNVLFGRQNFEVDAVEIYKHYSDTEKPENMDRLFRQMKKSVDSHHTIVSATYNKYMSEILLKEYNTELDKAKAECKKAGKSLLEEELLELKKGVASKVFCGVNVKFDIKPGIPVLSDHGYTVIDTYEKDGKKYVLVRNPHAGKGYKEGKPTEADKGYCEIPLEKYVGMFGVTHIAKPLGAKYYQNLSSEYHKPFSKLYQGFLSVQTRDEKFTLGFSMSKESTRLKNALKNIQKLQEQQFPSRRAITEACQKLEDAAKAYLVKHQNDNIAKMQDVTNHRIVIAKACMALTGSYLGLLTEKRDVQADIHRIGRMMVTERVRYVTQKSSENGQMQTDAQVSVTDMQVNKVLMPIEGDRLFDIALRTPKLELLGKVVDEVRKSESEKQMKATAPKEEVKQTEAEKAVNEKNTEVKEELKSEDFAIL